MTDDACTGCRALAPELALELVTGRERAGAVAHLQRCPSCRAHVEGLTRVHDALRTLLPAHEPPAGFESRVLARLPGPARRRDRRRRLALVAAAAAVLVGSGWTAGALTTGALTTGSGGPPPVAAGAAGATALRVAPLTAGGREVGQAFAHPGPPAWLYMYLDVDGPDGPLTCVVVGADGSRTVTGTFAARDGDAFWGGPVGTAAEVTAVEVTDPAGTLVATARFG